MSVDTLERATIPRGLDAMKPGPRLGALLSAIDVASLNGRDAVLFARAQQRQISHDQARQYRAISRISDLYAAESSEEAEFAAAELGAALTYTRRRADREMALAHDAARSYPDLLAALELGTIDLAKLRVIIRGVGHTDNEIAKSAIERILVEAEHLTTGQIAARLRRIVIEADPDEAKKAYEQATAEAKVWSCLEPDGSGTMISTGMEAYDLSAANRNINGLARKLKNAGDPRSIDKIRAEVFAALLSGQMTAEGLKAQVHITGDIETFAKLAEHPGHLNGFGPVIADIARQIADQQHDAMWTFEAKEPETGEIYVGTTSRRPTADLRRRVTARYPTCIHPGCRMPATQCDLDHGEDWAKGGLTTLCNLAPLCRHHHRLKHLTGWTYRKLADGAIEWVSQFGLRYITHPP